MCFKKPKPPEPTAEDKAREKELEEQLAARRREIAESRREQKESRTEEDIARAMGLFGLRSLIAGPKGGAGFGRGFRSIARAAGNGGGSGGSSGGGGGSGGVKEIPSISGGGGFITTKPWLNTSKGGSGPNPDL